MVLYQNGMLAIMDAQLGGEAPLDLLGDVVKLALMNTAYSINAATHDFFDDISANEITATNYSSRGNALASKTIALDGSGRSVFDAAAVTFSSIGNGTNDTTDQAVLLREQDSGATNGNSRLLSHYSIPSTTTNGGDIVIRWASTGIIRVAV